MAYETIEVRVEADQVGIITLNRPKQLNALNDQLMTELGAALREFDADAKIGCIIVTGSERAFAAGADIAAMPSSASRMCTRATSFRATGKPSAASANP